MTTHAPLRSRRTKAKSVYHVQGLGDGDFPTSPLKDTRLIEENLLTEIQYRTLTAFCCGPISRTASTHPWHLANPDTLDIAFNA